MLRILSTKTFEKDLKRAVKRGNNRAKIQSIMNKLALQEPLDSKHHDHKLTGNYAEHRECHIEPDWLLIYRVEEKAIVFERTGTHSDLFKR